MDNFCKSLKTLPVFTHPKMDTLQTKFIKKVFKLKDRAKEKKLSYYNLPAEKEINITSSDRTFPALYCR